MKKVFLDVECYKNYFLICFKSDIKLRTYELYKDIKLDIPEIKLIMSKYLTIGFNSFNYDLPMINYALSGASNTDLKRLSDELVLSDVKSWEICNKYNIRTPNTWNHIDLIEPSPGVMIGLKMYGARMHTRKLQDLPIEPGNLIEDNQINIIKEYCVNDVDITIELYNRVKNIIDLRQVMNDNNKSKNLDFRSKSDAQIAEAIFRESFGITKGVKNRIDTSYSYKYKAPCYINFINPDLVELKNKLEEVSFHVDVKGSLLLNKEVATKISIGKSKYTIGVGGLHSNEKHRAIIKKDNEFLIDIDVISYYPSIIINNGYSPPKLPEFLRYYTNLYNKRLKAKRENNISKSDAYKIILNGSFGKFGSVYSCLYSPSLLLHTTITGQLSLLMLIENIEKCDCSVISANTDGLTIIGDNNNLDKLYIELSKWEKLTNFKLDRVDYKAIYHESVNTYVAIKTDNTIKAKGFYANDGLSKHPIAKVCVKAVINYLTKKQPIESTILDKSNEITDFISIRKVKGGGIYNNDYLGKVVRWYYSTDGLKITYKTNGNLVANTEGSKPIMTIPDHNLTNIDYVKYIDTANKMLNRLGLSGD